MKNLSLLFVFALIFSACGQRDDGIVLSPEFNPEVVMASQVAQDSSDQEEAGGEVKVAALSKTLQKGTQVAKIKGKQEFVCKVSKAARQLNDEILAERRKFEELHRDLGLGLLKEADKLWMIEKLYKYRMIPGARYYSPTEYTAEQIADKIDDDTSDYFSRHGLPSKCQYTRFERGQHIQYKSPLESGVCLEEFMLRAQIIPEGMAVAQAVLESGWGSSRFAQAGNNTFGLQFSFPSREEALSRPYCILASGSSKRCLFRFVSLEDGVTEYFRFLNAGTYQDPFRQNRGVDEIGQGSCRASAREVIQGLTNYAENSSYIRDVTERMEDVCPMIEQCS